MLESDPYRRLAYTWHTYSTEWAELHGFDQEQAAIWAAEPRSKVAFDIEEFGPGVVKLTVVHDSVGPGQRRPAGRLAGLAGRAGQPQDTARDGIAPAVVIRPQGRDRPGNPPGAMTL